MILLEEERIWMNLKRHGMASKEMGGLEGMPCRPQPVLAQRTIAVKLPIAILGLSHDAFVRILEVPADLSLCGISWNAEFHQVKEDWCSLSKELNESMIDKEKVAETQLGMEVAINAMTRS